MKKLFQVIAVLAALTITACSGGNNGDSSSASSSAHTHIFVDDPAQAIAATCTAAGKTVEVCSVCGYEKETAIAKLNHTYVAVPAEAVVATCTEPGKTVERCSMCNDEKETVVPALGHAFALKTAGVEEEGYTKTDLYECSNCHKQAFQWDALDFDASSNDVSVSAEYIKFNTCQFDGGDAGIPGTHIIYKIKATAAVAHANLSMNISPKTGYAVGIFDYVSNDTKQGYVDDGTGNLVVTTKRYGLKVNGVAITLGTDKYVGLEPTADVAWYDWAADFPLVAGDNTIDIFCLGGYRHNMYDFRMFL